MREKSFALTLVLVFLGMMGTFPPGSAIPGEELPLYYETSEKIIGIIVIDPANAHYSTLANVGEQNGTLYYELMGYNPSGDPVIITWGMMKTERDGNLCFNDTFDPSTLAWIRSYGVSGAIYSARRL
jgi:hypothetical protein